MIRIVLPYHLKVLVGITGDALVEVPPPVTLRSLLDALEAKHPMLRGTIRDHATRERRAMIRFFACEEDVSLESPDKPLPEAIATGQESFWIVGALAGG